MHRLDPRTKIVGTVVYMVSLFCVNSFSAFALSILLLGTVIAVSKVPLRFIAKGLKPVLILIILTMLINLFLTPGELLLSLGPLKVTEEGIYRAAFMALRLVLLIFGSSMLTLTTKPIQLTDGMEALMKPFEQIGLPAHELAMMMTIALRFIPTHMDETDKIMKAQTARGADFESGNFKEKAKALVPLLVPLFVSAFRIAGDLAMAMEARCYRGGEGRTRMNPMRYSGRDGAAALILALYLAVIIFSRTLGLF